MGWAKLCTCLMGNVWLITWRSFVNPACYPSIGKCFQVEGKVKDTVVVNGVKQSLDLVALICYNKLRKKCLGITKLI